ncbi:MAG: GGDEF domain-containing protein, partial [Acidobacteriota bacterium]
IARFGGDEFVAVVPGVLEAKTIAALAAKTLKAIQRPCVFPEHGVTLTVTASIGIACYDGGETTPSQLVAEADALLYTAKERGRNNFCVAAWPRRAHSAAASIA